MFIGFDYSGAKGLLKWVTGWWLALNTVSGDSSMFYYLCITLSY